MLYRILKTLQPFLLPVSLIVVVAAMLLAMDPTNKPLSATAPRRVAIVQHASQGALEDGVTGILRALAARLPDPAAEAQSLLERSVNWLVLGLTLTVFVGPIIAVIVLYPQGVVVMP